MQSHYKIQTYNNATLEEYYMFEYLKELKENGFIDKIIFQPLTFKWFDGLKKDSYTFKALKTKTKKVYSTKKYLITPRSYTPDFYILWNKKYKNNLFIQSLELNELNMDIPFIMQNLKSYFEIKPEYDAQNMTRMFTSHIQPEVYNNLKIYVQLIKSFSLFKDTFIPKSIESSFYYKKSGKWGKKGDKKYKWEYKNLQEYLKIKQNE